MALIPGVVDTRETRDTTSPNGIGNIQLNGGGQRNFTVRTWSTGAVDDVLPGPPEIRARVTRWASPGGEGRTLRFRAEMHNIWNLTQFSGLDTAASLDVNRRALQDPLFGT